MDWQNLIADAAKRIEPFIVKTPIFSTKSIYPEYNIELNGDDIERAETINDLYELIKSKS